MARFQIKSPSGTVLYEGNPSYTGTYMKPGTLTFRQICSPYPIPFEIGCYVDYSLQVSRTETRTGLRYYMYSRPQMKRQARNYKSGESFVYDSVTFYDVTKLLDFVPFRDMVIADNKVHFSTKESWSTFENVAGIARRFQACFDVFYPNTITFTVASGAGVSPELAALMAEEREFSINGETLLGGLAKVYEVWPEVGWVFHRVTAGMLDFNEVLIGGAGLVGTAQDYLYGKGKGLKTLQRNLANEGEIVNRLYAYGNTKNLPPRYYNGKDIYCADTVDIQNLMIPIGEWGEEGDKPSARQAFLEDSSSQDRNGIRPKVVYFDGTNDNEDIYPTVKGLTVGDLRDYIDDGGSVDYAPGSQWQDSDPLDKVLVVIPDPSGVDNDFDKGITGEDGRVDVMKEFFDYDDDDVFLLPAGTNGHTEQLIAPSLGVRPIPDIDEGRRKATLDASGVSFHYSSAYPISSASLIFHFIKHSRVGATEEEVFTKEVALRVDYNGTYYESTGFGIDPITTDEFWMDDAEDYVVVRIDLKVRYQSHAAIESVNWEVAGQLSLGYSRKPITEFQAKVGPFGYDIKDLVTTDGDVRIAMTSGKCGGREFRVKKTSIYDRAGENSWYLTLERQYDESLSQYFPNSDYPVEADDTFVILGIAMPEFYISAAENRLLDAAQDYLDYYKREMWQYIPEVDSKYMVENKRRILPAQYMVIIDYNLMEGEIGSLSYFVESGGGYFLTESGQKIIVDQSGFAVSVLVDSVTIDEGAGALPSYKVTLRDRKRRKK